MSEIRLYALIPNAAVTVGQLIVKPKERNNMTTKTKSRELTLEDRCDSCSAAAKVIATFLNGELLFCGHHARKHLEALKTKAIDIYDTESEFQLT